MKVAVSSEGPEPELSVGRRFGVSPYFLIADLESGTFEAIQNPGSSGERGAGAQAVVLLLNLDVKVLLTGHCSPAIRHHLEANGVEVLSGLSGVVRDVVRRYRMGETGNREDEEVKTGLRMVSCGELRDAARRSWNQILSMLPMMAGVVLLVGLFNSFISRELIASIFSGNVILDTFWGACSGSLFVGNPINSYIIGGELLHQSVSLFAVTAFMITWITVGLVQLPAESAALGRGFAIRRNIACFLLAFPIAMATVFILAIWNGGPA